MYTVIFNTVEDITALDIKKGDRVFYLPDMTSFIMTNTLNKSGTDASNMFDEEVGEDELNFSDDEKELLFKKQNSDKKRKKK